MQNRHSDIKIFETKRLRLRDNNGEYDAIRIIISNQSSTEKKEIHRYVFKLGVQDHVLSGLPNQYHIKVSKDGSLKIDKLEDNHNHVFKLDNHDIELKGRIQSDGSLHIQTAKKISVTGKVNLKKQLKVESQSLHIRKTLRETASVCAHQLEAKTKVCINDGIIRTLAGCSFKDRGNLTNNGSIYNEKGQILFDVKNLKLYSKGGGVVCRGDITTGNLFSFNYDHHAFYAEESCSLNFVHSQKLNHVISMPGFINIKSHGGKISNHSIIQSEKGIQILTPFQWGENYSIENFGGLIATKGDIVFQGKGVVHTTNGHGIYASNGRPITNCTNVNLSGYVHGRSILNIGRDVYTTALNAKNNIITHATRATVAGYAIADGTTYISTQDTLNILGHLQSKDAVLSATNSITTAPPALIKSTDTASLTSNEVYLNGKTETGKQLDVVGTHAIKITGETTSHEDISLQTKTLLSEAPITAKKVVLDVDKIVDMKAEIKAQQIIINKPVEMVHCELISEDGKMVLRPLHSKIEQPTPEEMAEQQRLIEDHLEELAEAERENQAHRKKLKKRLFVNIVLANVAGIGLSAILGPQMVLLFGKLGVSGMAATLGSAIADGMIMNGVNAAIMGEKVLQNAVKGGALALFGPAKNLVNHVYDAATHKHPSFKNFAIAELSALLSSAMVGSTPTLAETTGNLTAKMGKAIAKESVSLGVEVAANKALRTGENLEAKVVTRLVGAAAANLAQAAITSIARQVEPVIENKVEETQSPHKTSQNNTPSPNKNFVATPEKKESVTQQAKQSECSFNNPEVRSWYRDDHKPYSTIRPKPTSNTTFLGMSDTSRSKIQDAKEKFTNAGTKMFKRVGNKVVAKCLDGILPGSGKEYERMQALASITNDTVRHAKTAKMQGRNPTAIPTCSLQRAHYEANIRKMAYKAADPILLTGVAAGGFVGLAGACVGAMGIELTANELGKLQEEECYKGLEVRAKSGLSR